MKLFLLKQIKKIIRTSALVFVFICFVSLGTFRHIYAAGVGGASGGGTGGATSGASAGGGAGGSSGGGSGKTTTYTNFGSERDTVLPCLCDWEEGEIKFIVYHTTIPDGNSLTLVYNLLESKIKENYNVTGKYYLGQYSSQTDTCNFGIGYYCVELTGQKWPTWGDSSTGIGAS